MSIGPFLCVQVVIRHVALLLCWLTVYFKVKTVFGSSLYINIISLGEKVNTLQ